MKLKNILKDKLKLCDYILLNNYILDNGQFKKVILVSGMTDDTITIGLEGEWALTHCDFKKLKVYTDEEVINILQNTLKQKNEPSC